MSLVLGIILVIVEPVNLTQIPGMVIASVIVSRNVATDAQNYSPTPPPPRFPISMAGTKVNFKLFLGALTGRRQVLSS